MHCTSMHSRIQHILRRGWNGNRRGLQHIVGLVLTSALLVSGSLTRLTPSPSAWAQSNTENDTLRVILPPPDTLDPSQVSRFDIGGRDLIENLFVGLTRFDPYTQEIEPLLATEWNVSPDGLKWTFTLREDIQWIRYNPTTGAIEAVRPVAAGDFVYAIQRSCDPLRPSPVTANLMILRGCQTVANAFPEVISDVFIAREIGVRATGPHTLEMELLFPAAYFPVLLSMPEFRPLPREAITSSPDAWTDPATIMTNGPFAVAPSENADLSLVQNPLWPLPVEGNTAGVEVTYSDNPNTILSAITAADSDYARLPAASLDRARVSAPDLVRTQPGNTLIMLGFARDRAVVGEIATRRALALALDRAKLTQEHLEGYEPVDQFTPPGLVASPQITGIDHDPGQAQAVFANAGHPECSNVPEKLSMMVPDDDPMWLALGQAVAQQWVDTLGCNPGLFEVTPVARTLLIELTHSTYDPEQITRPHVWLATWSADYLDANAWLSDALHCRYGYVRIGRPCTDADTLLDRAAVADNSAQRAELYTQAETALLGNEGDLPVLPLALATNAWLEHPWLSGVNTTGPLRFDLWQLEPGSQ